MAANSAARRLDGPAENRAGQRSSGGGPVMRRVAEDLRQAVRSAGRAPGFTAMVALTLALGIGATTAAYSAIRAVLLRPLPYPAPEELVQVYTTWHGSASNVSPPDFADFRAENRSFRELAALNARTSPLTGEGPAEQIPDAEVTGGFFAVLGVDAAVGRTLGPDDDRPGERVVVLGHGLWTRRFGTDSGIVGRTIQLRGEPHVVVGVMPRGFSYPLGAELWTPTGFTAEVLRTQRGAQYLDVIGRLKPGVTAAEASADIVTIAARLRDAYPQSNSEKGATLQPFRDALVGDARPALLVLFGAVVLVLLLACVNVTGLLLARGLARTRDQAIRAALGANRGRLVSQMLAESLVLGVIGGGAGVLLAIWGSAAIAATDAAGIALLDQSRLDGPVLLFAIGVTVVAGLLSGLFPAWRATTTSDLTSRIRASGGGGDRSQRRTRASLVVVQLALAVTLLVGAGLLLRSFRHLTRVDFGFRPDGVQTFAASLPDARYDRERARAFVATLTGELARLPGVDVAGAVFGLPLTGFGYTISAYTIDGRVLDDREQDRLNLNVRVVTPDYFRAMGIPMLRGRGFTAEDRQASRPVTVLSASAARLLWPEGDPMGHSTELGTRLGLGRDWPRVGGEVVGVVGDVHDLGPATPPGPTLYVAHAQFPVGYLAWTLRGRGEPGALVEPIRKVLAAHDPDIPMFRVRSMDQLVAAATARERLYLLLVGGFAVTATLLAALGTYGVMTQLVVQRTREFGIRLALGATPPSVVTRVLGDGVRLALFGVILGLGLAALFMWRLGPLLYGVSPGDPFALAGAAAVLLVAAALACFVPARRAARVDPMTALRSD